MCISIESKAIVQQVLVSSTSGITAMFSSPLVNLIAVGSSLVPAAKSAAIAPQVLLSPSNESVYLEGFPHPNPVKSYWQDPPHRIANLRTTPELPLEDTFD